jgi:hypothetical protein
MTGMANWVNSDGSSELVRVSTLARLPALRSLVGLAKN